MVILRIWLDAIRIAIGLVFLFSALGKLGDPRGFVHGVVEYQVLPKPLAVTYGVVLIPIEGFVSAALLSNRFVLQGVAVAAFLLCSFLIGVGINVRRRRDVSCHCFGSIGTERISMHSIVRICLLMVRAIGALASYHWPYYSSPVTLSQAMIDALLRLTLAVAVLLAGMWGLAMPTLLQPWKAMLRHRARVKG